jgi:DNA-directed RNA polymerase specialized sigma24 family protein
VSSLYAHRVKESTENQYATSEDFRQLFIEDAHILYLLSFLLTANHEMAERCFVAGLDDCADGNAVFLEWARSWARRVIVRNAIRIIGPQPVSTGQTQSAFHSAGEGELSTMPLQDARFAKILALQDFERFVYILSVLEGYSEQECAALLGTSRKEIRETRLRAEQHIADLEKEER